MLSRFSVKAFIPTAKANQAKAFYRGVLGLTLLTEDEFALEFDANGTPLRVTIVESFSPQPFTVFGWSVIDISTVIRSLVKKGVRFERYDFFEQDSLGIWTAPGGTKVAWFKDPDGNLLSLSE